MLKNPTQVRNVFYCVILHDIDTLHIFDTKSQNFF